jgi:hypothetical protein
VTATTRPPARTDTRRPAINRKHISKRPAGDLNAYRKDGCRCYPCSGAWGTYCKRQKASDWKPFVDARPVRDHLAYLSANGVGLRQVAKITGIARTNLQAMTEPDRPRGVRTHLAEKILAIRPNIDTVGDRAYLDATGTYRRLQALVALGFSTHYLAQRLGWRQGSMRVVPSRPHVQGAFARAVRDLYDELWNAKPEQFGLRPAGITGARKRAAANGWALPAEWDDDEIDDPAAQPHRARRTDEADDRPVTEAELEDTQWIIATLDVDVTKKAGRDLAAARLGIKPARLEYIVARKLPKLERQAVAA